MSQYPGTSRTHQIIACENAAKTMMGRYHALPNGQLQFSYPGVSLGLKVSAKSMRMNVQSSLGNSYLDIQIDNRPIQTFCVPQKATNITLFADKLETQHSVLIVNRSESLHGVNQINSFAIEQGQLCPPPPLPLRKILILGDSVTCGEVIDRTTTEDKNPSWWNPQASYGMLAAKALDAQVHLVCRGGRGLVRSWTGVTTELNLADFYPLTFATNGDTPKWDSQRYQPDLIISAIGTNDFKQGIPAEDWYVSSYIDLLNKIRTDYPKTCIGLMEGSMLYGEKKQALIGYIEKAIDLTKDDNLVQFRCNHYPGDEMDIHPTKAEHTNMAADLVPQIKTQLGW